VFYKIHDHYLNVAEQLRLEETVKLHKYSGNTVIVLVGNVTKVNIGALNYARSIGDTVIAMHVSTTADKKREARIKKEFKERFPDIHSTIVNTAYRSVENPVIRYVDLVSKESKKENHTTTVLISQFVPRRRWQNILHNQTNLRLAFRLS